MMWTDANCLAAGLMRLDECPQVKETLQEHLGINLIVVDGSELFLSRLAGVTEPETKRKIIGGTCKLKMGCFQAWLLTCTVIDLFEIEALRYARSSRKSTPEFCRLG